MTLQFKRRQAVKFEFDVKLKVYPRPFNPDGGYLVLKNNSQ